MDEYRVFVCPLCDAEMRLDDGRYICTGNVNHILSSADELMPYLRGEKNANWLRQRMKIRVGKLVHKR